MPTRVSWSVLMEQLLEADEVERKVVTEQKCSIFILKKLPLLFYQL